MAFMQDNNASRMAFRMARYLLKSDADELLLVNIVQTSDQVSMATDFLNKLRDEKVNTQVRRLVLPKGAGSTIEQMIEVIEAE